MASKGVLPHSALLFTFYIHGTVVLLDGIGHVVASTSTLEAPICLINSFIHYSTSFNTTLLLDRGGIKGKVEKELSKHLNKSAGVFVHPLFLFSCSLINIYATEPHQGETFGLSHDCSLSSKPSSPNLPILHIYSHVDLNASTLQRLPTFTSAPLSCCWHQLCVDRLDYESVAGKDEPTERLNRKEERRVGRCSLQERRAELGNDKCWMVFRHYYSGCILLHCSGTLTHIPNCTLAGFSISLVHFPVVYMIQSLRAVMNLVSECPWAMCAPRLRCQPAVVLAPLLNMQIVHKQHNGPKLGLWSTLPLWLPPSSPSFSQWYNAISCIICGAVNLQMTEGGTLHQQQLSIL